MKENYELEVLHIIKDVLTEDKIPAIDPNVAFQKQLEIDSMDFLDIIMQIKEKYSLEIPGEDYSHFTTMNKLTGYLIDRIDNKQNKSENLEL